MNKRSSIKFAFIGLIRKAKGLRSIFSHADTEREKIKVVRIKTNTNKNTPPINPHQNISHIIPVALVNQTKTPRSPTRKYVMKETLRNEILSLLNGRVSRLTHTTIIKHYREDTLKSFEIFDKHVFLIDPECARDSLKCYTSEHARSFKVEMDREGKTSPLTGRIVKKGYLSRGVLQTRNVFTYAVDTGLLVTNIFQSISIHKYQNRQVSSDFFRADVIDQLTNINHALFEKMTIKEKYIYLLPKVMIRIGYEIAARSCEIVRLCIEDIQFEKKRPSGLIPVAIVGGKARPAGFTDVVWIFGDRIESCLQLWLKTKKEFLDKYKRKDMAIDIPKRESKATPLFEDPDDFSLLNEKTNYKTIYKNTLQENNILARLFGKTHILRISRITNWVSEGWDFYDVHKNARHAKFEETERYTKGNSEDRATRIEKNLHLNISPVIDDFTLPDEHKLTFILFKFIEMIKIRKVDIFGVSNIPGLVKSLLAHMSAGAEEINTAEYYNIHDMEIIWDLKNSQAWKRLRLIKDSGLIHLSKSKTGQVLVPKSEIYAFERYIELSKAALIYSITGRGQLNHIRKMATKGTIKAIKIPKCKLWFLDKSSLEKWLSKIRDKRHE